MRRFVLVTLLVVSASTAARETATPGRDWPQFRGIAAGGVSEGAATASSWNVPAGERVKWKTAIPGLGHSSPIVYGDLVCVATALSGKADPELKVGLYGDIKPVEDDSVHSWKSVPRLQERQGEVGTDCGHRRAEDQAPHQGHARQLDAGHRRQARSSRSSDRKGCTATTSEGQAAVEEGLRRARLRLLHGARGAMGLCQFAGDPRRPRDPAVRRAEGLVSWRVLAEGRPRAVAHARARTCRRGARQPW